MIDKNLAPTKLLWVDLEMTGLDPQQDVILEIAAEVTDFEFKTLASYEATINQPEELVSQLMAKNSWWADYPANRDDFLGKLSSGKTADQVEADILVLIDQYFKQEPAVLAGNSIHNDRRFIRHYWPKFESKLHYRMLDVSAWKVLMQGKYGLSFDKKEVHRAFDDIQASIAELQFYIEWFRNER